MHSRLNDNTVTVDLSNQNTGHSSLIRTLSGVRMMALLYKTTPEMRTLFNKVTSSSPQ